MPTGPVLTVNAGSTSLKVRLVDPAGASEDVPSLEAVPPGVVAVGHRIVHGGPRLTAPALLDDDTAAGLREAAALAPLHDRPAIDAIAEARRALPDVPHVLVPDTAFHTTMPAEATTYAVPARWREEWGVRRYGFHGLSVGWAAERAAAMLGRDDLRLVVCHLGGGASVTAVRAGRSVDTTMGFGPLEGRGDGHPLRLGRPGRAAAPGAAPRGPCGGGGAGAERGQRPAGPGGDRRHA